MLEQHDVVLALHALLPVCVLGDPLQNIFNFGSNVTVKWNKDVTATWPALDLPVQPWRWRGHHEDLGRWLIDIRADLRNDRPIDLGAAPLRWRANAPQEYVRACFAQPTGGGTVVAISPWAHECATLASKTAGSYGMMEELQGGFMLKFAAVLDSGEPQQTAVATLQFAKDCISRIADKLDTTVKGKLARGESVAHLKRAGAEASLALLSELLSDPSPGRVREALAAIGRLPGGRLYRREAWRDLLKALQIVSVGGELTVAQAVARIRNQTRITGRAPDDRVISRPLLIKGLEYDHAVVLGADRIRHRTVPQGQPCGTVRCPDLAMSVPNRLETRGQVPWKRANYRGKSQLGAPWLPASSPSPICSSQSHHSARPGRR